LKRRDLPGLAWPGYDPTPEDAEQGMVDYLSTEEIARWRPDPWTPAERSPTETVRARLREAGQWGPSQALGRRWPVGCVALEITQRCNLDCSVCYLSENAEAVRDVPLAELFRRIDAIADLYGPNTDVQVTGGDPTLRDRAELIEIVARIRARGLRGSLFTNGIRAKRDLLEDLADAGLVDVAFHVDLTQGRKGYTTEAELNALRRAYVERARGLPLAVIFNTTVFARNLHEVPALAGFFARRADVVRMASFQLQAQAGRGAERPRDRRITMDAVAGLIEAGIGARLTFDALRAGHARCNRYAMALVAGGRAHDLLDDKPFIARMLADAAGLQFDRARPGRALAALAAWYLAHPRVWPAGAAWAVRKLRALAGDAIAARGRVDKLSFFIHDFMDSGCLEAGRLKACAFMAATAQGPVSMCLHNAKRDSFLFRPLALDRGGAARFWDPGSGRLLRDEPAGAPVAPPPKLLKGRARPR
jgi:molybdenum cofactor biosynthesis enzyme MoaA